LKIAKVDATKEEKLSKRFDIKGFPTLKIFPKGRKRDKDAFDYPGGREIDNFISYFKSKFKIELQRKEEDLLK
jgi:hypothetical protein